MIQNRLSRLSWNPVYSPLLDRQIQERTEPPKRTPEEEAGEDAVRERTARTDRRIRFDLD